MKIMYSKTLEFNNPQFTYFEFLLMSVETTIETIIMVEPLFQVKETSIIIKAAISGPKLCNIPCCINSPL